MRDDPALIGRPLIVWNGLSQHRRAFLPDRPARAVEDGPALLTGWRFRAGSTR